MKKITIIALMFLLVAGLFAASTRAYTQKVVDPNSALNNLQFPDVVNTSLQTAPGYVVNAWIASRPAEVTSTLTHIPTLIRLYRFGNGTTMPYDTRVFVQLSTFTTQWVGGDVLHVQIINNNVNPAMTDFWEITIPDNSGAAWTVTTPVEMELWPVVIPATYTVNMTTNPAGYITPSTLGPVTDVTTIYGTYTPTPLPAPATGYWTPASLVIDAATVWTADGANWLLNQEFVWTETTTGNYTLNINGPAGTAVTGPVAGTIPYVATDDVVGDLVGMYTAAEAPAGFAWAVNPIEVTAGMFAPVTKGAALGSRNTSSKVHTEYAATIAFELVALPTYTVNLTTNPAGNITPSTVGPTWDVTATYGTYTPNPIAGGTWTPASLVIDAATVWTADGANWVLNQEFVWTEDAPTYDFPEGTPVVVVIGTVTVNGGNGNDVPTGSVPPIPNGAFVPEFQTVMQLLGAGPWTISFGTTQPWGAWYSYTSAAWMVVPNVGGMITFVIPAGGKDIPEVPMVFGPVDPTLPVELSSFNAVLTAENFVKLTWTSESETNMLGYRVYRAEADDYAAATLITPVMIEATNSSTHQAYSITDNEVAINTTYYYWLEAVDMSHSVLYGPNAILVTGNVTPNIPTVTTLGNAYPNPFRNQTSIALEVKENETATVTIYNILGQVVKTYNKGQGTHTINWDGKDARGNACGSGIYFYRLTSPSMNQTKKMVIVK
ncbi:MAG: hypothetical protein CVU49_06925 [Candidatus Cloacimonetes bacterium HGW-Cloacimonetes-2]|jgi:hypothetical protein|nr:MAG: hypothetical protein CVU49_06925 [Candidatus Cloacimonetes bacterium HGW-Cloacimonetes-2]